MIISVHNQEPGTPLDPYRPGLQRYQIGAVWVDVTDAPTLTEAQAQYTAYQNAVGVETKKKILADAMAKREVLLSHLRWFYVMAKEEPDGEPKVAKLAAILTAINSFHTVFTDPRIVNAVDGAAKLAIFIVYKEITDALKAASLSTYNAIKALDAL